MVCNAGVCSACTANLACATNPDPCLKGITSCTTGTQACVDDPLSPEANGLACGTNLVCYNGVCSPCTAGASCTYNPSPCLAGTTSCSTGTETCLDTATPLPNGTSCGTNLVCNAGTCVSCTAGLACTGNPDPCRLGTTSCATGTQTCVDGTTPAPNGTSCGTNLVCYAGSCVSCTAGLACTTNPDSLCHDGVTSCATGTQTCVDGTAKPNGTSCGSNLVCNAGTCVSCTAGLACTTNPSPACWDGLTSCATGTQTCVDGTAKPNGTACDVDPLQPEVCSGGTCTVCYAGQPCTTNPDTACHDGITSCATGTQTCVDGTAKPNGTTCGVNQVCSAGVCLPCTAGLACTTDPDPCRTGVTSCDTGTSVCVTTSTLEPNGTSCGTNLVCNAGTCVSCTAGLACATNPDTLCHDGTTSCATGTQTCVDGTAKPNGTTCGTNMVCNAGVCTACTAGLACTGNPTPCRVGTTSCATGTQTCVDTATPAADGTSCGTGQTCDAGSCVASRTVTGTRMVTTWGAGTGCTSATPCRTTVVAPDVIGSPFAAVAALVPDGAGGFRRYAGAFSADGSCSIPNVPAGTYLLELVEGAGLVRYVETSSSVVDLGYDVLGRQDLAPATLPTLVTFNLSGLEPWGAGHEIQLASAGADLWDFPPAGGIALGQVSGTVLEDWSAPAVGRPLGLLAATDILYVAQNPSYTATEGVQAYAYWRAAAAAPVSGVALSNGMPATIAAALAPVTRTSTVSVDWRVTEFEALLAGMGPSATPLPASPHELTVEAGAYYQLDPWPEGRGGTPETFRMVRGTATPDVVVTTSIVYGQYAEENLWSEWRSVAFTATVLYTAPGATTPLEARASIGRREPMLPAPPTPIVPAVGTVRSPLVAGSPALGTIPPTGLTPLVSWTAPLAGSPTSYRVTVHRLANDVGATRSAPVATWLVPGTSLGVRIPSGVLQAGGQYYLEIVAQVRAAEAFDVAPVRTPRSVSHATTLTAPFSP
ncbi:MAG TPA: hypothetical protein VLS93_09485 [Anaeromyxobacteraceae bacterium]|nr:hypothetical protein [Anaeromyxobacteraceae bacterium]